MKYRLCDDPWGAEEPKAIRRVTESGIFTMGENVREFEKRFAEKFGSRYAIMTNSGSTANLLAIASLVYSGMLDRGSEVIVPAVSWSTTYAPLEQYGMKIVFADIDPDTLNISTESLRNLITDRTRMIFLVNLLGNPNEFDEILELCKDRDIIVAEDNCESLGAKYNGKYCGTFGLFGTFSTFYSHHLCTMEGGVVVTDDRFLYEYMLSVRAHGWTRNLPGDSLIHSKHADPFYESFNFIVPGYNLRPLEMEGAIGVEQLRKADEMLIVRRSNAAYFRNRLEGIDGIRLQKEVGESSWFGFSVVLENELSGRRDGIVRALREAEIECRPIVAGNFVRNPVVKYFDYSVPKPLVHADDIHFNGFFVGNHSKDNHAEADYFAEVLSKAVKEI